MHLQEFEVARQAYYGGTFVGNHVQKCLQVQHTSIMIPTLTLSLLVYVDKMCHSVVEIAQQQPSMDVREHAELIYLTFRDAFTLFEGCHSPYTGSTLSSTECDQLGKYT